MVLSKKQSWDKYHKEAIKEKNPENYINERGLEIIRVAEGHDKGYDPKSKTTYYGITQTAIDGLEALQRVYKIKIPEWLRDAKADKINESQAKDIARYHAMLNTMLIEDFSSSPNFSKLSLDTRSAFLTYFHNVSPYSMRTSFEENKPGSFLRAVRTGNPYLMGQALISRADGSSLGEIDDGYKRRAMMTIMAIGNKKFTMDKQQERDMDIRFKLNGFGQEAHQRLGELANNWFQYRKNIGKIIMPEEKSNEQKAEENKGILQKAAVGLTSMAQKLFTKNEEQQNGTTGNPDVNLQQSSSPNR